MAVTPTVLETWGITVEQLHQDALASDMNRHPMFCDMQNMMESMIFGKEPENLLDNGSGQSRMGMYCLTNGDKMNGAGLILQGELMQQIGEIVGGNFYILPSSYQLVYIHTNLMHFKKLFLKVRCISIYDDSVDCHLTKIGSHVCSS